MVPSVYDRTLVPPDSSGDTMYVFLPAVPHTPVSGPWSREAQPYLDRTIKTMGDYLTDLPDLLIGSAATSPADMEAVSGLHMGHVFHVDMKLNQFGPWRPVPSLAGFATPVDGLWHSGAGNHPMGTLSGWSGRAVARRVLRSRA